MKNVGTAKKPNYVEIINKCNFVFDWLKDETRRTLTKMDFVPSNPKTTLAPKCIYNMFQGYSAKLPEYRILIIFLLLL